MSTEKPLVPKDSFESEAEKESNAALKAEVEMELRSLKQCAYNSYECTQLTYENYDYCMKHILSDKNAPYRQCSYNYSNGKRCYMPAPKDKKEAGYYYRYCNEHAVKVHLSNSKRSNPYAAPQTTEVMLHSVSHYVKPNLHLSMEEIISPDQTNALVTKCNDPFLGIDANSILATGSKILDCASESESDVESATYGNVWNDAHAESSDDDSYDSEEDLLKHANVYSAEEVTLIARNKLMRLRDLYIEQYNYLHHALRERKRQYLHALKREKESYSSICGQSRDTPKEQRLYKKLKAYNSYHKRYGIEAICQKRLHERRVKATEGLAPKTTSFSKCIYMEGGIKCGERALPTAKHCRKHILEDQNQVLFRACGKMHGDIECSTPMETIFDNANCRLHMDIPSIRSYSQIRKDSESDFEDSLEQKPPLLTREENFNVEENATNIDVWEEFNKNLKMEVDVSQDKILYSDVEMSNMLQPSINSIKNEVNTLENEDDRTDCKSENEMCIGFPALSSSRADEQSKAMSPDIKSEEPKMITENLIKCQNPICQNGTSTAVCYIIKK